MQTKERGRPRNSNPKDIQVSIRVTREQRELLEAAASIQKRTLTNFVAVAAILAAENTIRQKT